MKTQKKRANEAKNEKIVTAGGKFQKEFPCFYFILLILPRISAILANIPRLILQFCVFLRISSPHFHLFSVVCINTRLRHPQSGATFQHLRRFHPCFVHGKALLSSFSPHLQQNRKKNCAFLASFFMKCIVCSRFQLRFFKICFCQEHGRDSIVSHETFSIQLFSFSFHRLIILVFGTHKPHYGIFFSFFACCAPRMLLFLLDFTAMWFVAFATPVFTIKKQRRGAC